VRVILLLHMQSTGNLLASRRKEKLLRTVGNLLSAWRLIITSGDPSVGIVRSQTKATKFSFFQVVISRKCLAYIHPSFP
jgi:hypothetical protein